MGEHNLLTKLKEVLDEFENLEKHYRKIHNSSVDIEDFEVSQKTQADSYLKIRELKGWKNKVTDLDNDVNHSNIVEIISSLEMNDEIPNKSEMSDSTTQDSPVYDSQEQKKVGNYVCGKMRELSKSGFTFSDVDIEVMQKNHWAKKVTYINHALTEQMKKKLGYDQFWKEIFSFGKHKILVTNQLFESDICRFDIWYDQLDKTNYSPKQNMQDVKKITNNEPGDYTCKKPINIKLFDKVYPIRYWNEVLVNVCEIMILKKPYIVATFGRETKLNSDQYTNFSYKESEIKVNKTRLSNGLWVEANRSANDIVMVCKTILELCEFSEKDLTIDFE